MVFDSSLIILSSNIKPDMDAMYRRFTDTCGAFCVDNKVQARKRLPVFLLRMIEENIKFHTDIERDIQAIVNLLMHLYTMYLD